MTLDQQKAIWAAEDAAALALGKAQDEYYAFITKVAAMEVRDGQDRAYLTDEGVDNENSIHHGYGTLAYWKTMLASAEDALQSRADEQGINL